MICSRNLHSNESSKVYLVASPLLIDMYRTHFADSNNCVFPAGTLIVELTLRMNAVTPLVDSRRLNVYRHN